ncbi:MAG: pilus (MSHA type) biogenesis protein MshL [Desulfocapsaceae bacterium]|nr:pilus (MSHA type) biogenesis protein MshL [Desulfocapsaceae bacterium]
MKIRSQVAPALAIFLLSLVLFSCSPLTAEPEKQTAQAVKPVTQDATPPSLPVQYQKPSYLVDPTSKDALDNKTDDAVLKVGAKISSTKKVALREIMKPLASQKKLNISWASDVNQDALVDVDIQANDDFYKAIENLLRQVDYFYEINGTTLIIKYRETKQFQIAMPFKKQSFSTSTGGNVLGGGGEDVAKNIEGTLKLTSEKNEFDIWENIKSHMDSILKIEKTVKISTTDTGDTSGNGKDDAKKEGKKEVTKEETKATLESYYLIDKPVGLITVTAPRPILDKVETYFTSLKKELYKQISIEAKIIEVQLTDDSSVGINWTKVLKNFDINGAVQFGAQTLGNGVTQVGQVFPYVFANEKNVDKNGQITYANGNHGSVYDPTRLISSVRINTANFDVFLNALKTEGNTKILSNPKISALNGQPSMISVGRNVTYVKKITSTVTAGTGGAAATVNFTAEPGSILSGVGLGLTATILDNNEIIMDLVPVTSELEEGTEKAVIVAGEGATAISMGLPNVNIREMSTTVRVKDGEMLVIGGLISEINQTDGNFAPVVGDIPLIKYLFGHEEKVKHKRELIILLKPHII